MIFLLKQQTKRVYAYIFGRVHWPLAGIQSRVQCPERRKLYIFYIYISNTQNFTLYLFLARPAFLFVQASFRLGLSWPDQIEREKIGLGGLTGPTFSSLPPPPLFLMTFFLFYAITFLVGNLLYYYLLSPCPCD